MRKRHEPSSPPAARGPSLTHPERIVFPADGIAKRQLAAYYETLSEAIWPHLERRPLSILRAVGGTKTFFQRHLGDSSIPGLAPAGIGNDKTRSYFYCASPAGLASLAQMAAVELHTWGARLPGADRADRLTFDLDPDPTLDWRAVRDAALLVRDFLAELGLAAQLKTTGGRGLHVVVPLTGRLPAFGRAASFAQAVARHLATTAPERFTARRGSQNRRRKIYVDWQRNQDAATTVAAYSPRLRDGVPVSMPIAWEELGRQDLRGARFNLRNAAARLRDTGDPWRRDPPPRQSLTDALLRRLDAAA
jgi:bifunctional non-homologous end joining protein LigD